MSVVEGSSRSGLGGRTARGGFEADEGLWSQKSVRFVPVCCKGTNARGEGWAARAASAARPLIAGAAGEERAAAAHRGEYPRNVKHTLRPRRASGERLGDSVGQQRHGAANRDADGLAALVSWAGLEVAGDEVAPVGEREQHAVGAAAQKRDLAGRRSEGRVDGLVTGAAYASRTYLPPSSGASVLSPEFRAAKLNAMWPEQGTASRRVRMASAPDHSPTRTAACCSSESEKARTSF